MIYGSTVEDELVKFTKVKRRNTEKKQTYLARVVKKVTELDDDVWEQMSEAAQEWSNAASVAFNKKKDIPEFPVDEEPEEGEEDVDDVDDESDDPEDEDDDDEEEEVKPKKTSKASKSTTATKGSAKSTPSKKDTESKTSSKPKVSAKKEPKKAPKKESAKTTEGGKPRGGGVAIKEIMVRDPHISIEDLTAELHANSFSLTEFTIASIRSEFRQTLKVLNNLGVLSDELSDRLTDKY